MTGIAQLLGLVLYVFAMAVLAFLVLVGWLFLILWDGVRHCTEKARTAQRAVPTDCGCPTKNTTR